MQSSTGYTKLTLSADVPPLTVQSYYVEWIRYHSGGLTEESQQTFLVASALSFS